MHAIINATIVTENGVIPKGSVLFDRYIQKIGTDLNTDGCDVCDAAGKLVIPGLIDLHIHGYIGCDVSDGDRQSIANISQALPANGVTAWCPTTMTVQQSQIEDALCSIAAEMHSSQGAAVLGANVEGPFINPAKKGAQSEKYILPPNTSWVFKHQNAIRMITVAPETDKDNNFIKNVSENTNIVVSVGHTDADYDTAHNAFCAGASHVTHLFNAMPPLMHRSPGVIGAAFADDRVSCELIADTFHVSPHLYSMVYRVKKDNLVLITDCMRAGGMPDGIYTLGGQDVCVSGIACQLKDGTIAGSILTLNHAVRNFYNHAGIPLHQAVNLATLNPARVIGEDDRRGSVSPGKLADLVICNRDFRIYKTYIGGDIAYNAPKNI